MSSCSNNFQLLQDSALLCLGSDIMNGWKNGEVDALIFDCDGTLVNSMGYFWHNGWLALCKDDYPHFTEEVFLSLAGLPVREIVANHVIKCSDLNDPRVDDFLQKKHDMVKNARERGEYPTDITCVTDVCRFNMGLKESDSSSCKKLRMAVASSGDRQHVLSDLEFRNLNSFFNLNNLDVPIAQGVSSLIDDDDEPKRNLTNMSESHLIVTRECVKNGKPEPDLFLEACSRLGVRPERCVGFEDADLGIEALKRAGFQQKFIVDVRKIKRYPN